MKDVFIISENITLLCVTILKILIICYTILFWRHPVSVISTNTEYSMTPAVFHKSFKTFRSVEKAFKDSKYSVTVAPIHFQKLLLDPRIWREIVTVVRILACNEGGVEFNS